MNPVRLLLAEDHEQMRETIARMLEQEFEVVGAVGDGQALVEAESRLKPDVCVLDISMPVLDGFEAASLLKQSGSIAKIIFLTAYERSEVLEAALEAGALGYVVKRRIASDLPLAIREAMAGRQFISPSMSYPPFSATSGSLS